jgi:uncharacterized protein with HEPN domain
MSERSAALLIDDILEAASKIASYTVGMGREDFVSSGMAADAVVRNLEIIGEAANRLPMEFTDKHPEIEWRKIIGLRHRIVHDYFGVDLDIIWTITRQDLPDFISKITTP